MYLEGSLRTPPLSSRETFIDYYNKTKDESLRKFTLRIFLTSLLKGARGGKDKGSRVSRVTLYEKGLGPLPSTEDVGVRTSIMLQSAILCMARSLRRRGVVKFSILRTIAYDTVAGAVPQGRYFDDGNSRRVNICGAKEDDRAGATTGWAFVGYIW